MSLLTRRLLVLTATLAMLSSCLVHAEQAVLTLSGRGGEAWAFRRTIEGTLVRGQCADIRIVTPKGEYHATRIGNAFVAMVDLADGRNEVQAVCHQGERRIASSEEQHWIVPLPDRPKAWARAIVTHDGLILDGGRSETAPVRPAPIVRYEWRMGPRGFGDTITGRRVSVGNAMNDGDHGVILRVTDALGRSDEAATIVRVREGRAVDVDLTRQAPPWVDGAVVYGAVPFLFGSRGLADVSARLDAIAALGATAIWLSPITESPSGDFGYAVTDHFALSAALGSEADLRNLVQAAHARGLRVLLDFVPNHLSDRHRYHLDTAKQGSPYTDFFDRDGLGRVTHYFGWSHLKNLNFDNAEVQRYMTEAFARWIRDFDVDGFRVDVSWGIRERAPEFWPRWREELKRLKPDILLIAEASTRDPYYAAHGFDAAYDWTDKLGEWAWHDAFEDPDRSASRLKAALRAESADSLAFRFLENNDTGPRFITRYGPSRTVLAATMLLTLPGIPLIYAGQEIGAEFEPYGGRQPIDWKYDPHGLRAVYTQLIRLRAAHRALRSRQIQLIDSPSDSGVVAYLRPGETSADGLLVLLNFRHEPAKFDLPDDALVTSYFDLLNGEVISLHDARQRTVVIPRSGARILRQIEDPQMPDVR